MTRITPVLPVTADMKRRTRRPDFRKQFEGNEYVTQSEALADDVRDAKTDERRLLNILA